MFGQDVTFAQLATCFHVNAIEILSELCKAHGTNAAAFETLHQELLRVRPDLTSYTGRKDRAHQYWVQAHGGSALVHPRNLPFLDWKIPQTVTIRLPRSAADALLVSADATTASAFIKLAISCPNFAKLELIGDRIETLAGELDTLLGELRASVDEHSKAGLTYLLSASQLITMMHDVIPKTQDAQIQHSATKHAELYAELQGLAARATHLICHDEHLFNAKVNYKININATELLGELSSADNVAVLQGLLPYYDAAEAVEAWDDFEFALRYAATVISRSRYVDDFVADHAIPLFKAVAEHADVKNVLVQIDSEPHRSALATGWRSLGKTGLSDSLFATVGTISSLGGGMIGNSRGPASMLVAVVMMAGPACSKYLAKHSITLNNSGIVASTLCYRVILQVSQFGSSTADELWKMIFPKGGGAGDLEKLRKIKAVLRI